MALETSFRIPVQGIPMIIGGNHHPTKLIIEDHLQRVIHSMAFILSNWLWRAFYEAFLVVGFY